MKNDYAFRKRKEKKRKSKTRDTFCFWPQMHASRLTGKFYKDDQRKQA